VADYFKRIEGRVNLELMQRSRAVVFGLGSVGSRVSEQLARSAVGELLLVDGDVLKEENVTRNLLGAESIGENKAYAVANELARTIPSLHVEYLPDYVDDGVPDIALDRLLSGADLIIAATDDRRAQRRINRRALELEIPALYPGVDAAADRGEVFVALGRGISPCFSCWDSFRAEDVTLREVQALDVEIYATVEATVRLALGLLDPESEFARPMLGNRLNPRPRTIFFVSSFGSRPRGMFADGHRVRRAVAEFRVGCPDCGGNPVTDGSEGTNSRPQRPPATRAGSFRPATVGGDDIGMATGLARRLLVAILLPLVFLASLTNSGLLWSLMLAGVLALALTYALERLRGG
jgi:molybdopterin/thiamine biosynthesis adenylyltransferase